MSGVIVERRDQVLMTCGRCPPERTRSTILRMPLSIQGPFLTERGITLFRIADCECGIQIRIPKSAFSNLFDSPISDDHLLGALVLARLVPAGRLAPGRHRIAASRSLAFTTAVRMVHRVHRHPAYVRAN